MGRHAIVASTLRRSPWLQAQLLIALALLIACALPVQAQQGTYTLKAMTPETAQAAAMAALLHCRAQGHQVGVAVVDRSGVLQAFVRDRYAGAHTVEMATGKAWTAASFRIDTTALAAETQPGKSMSGIRSHPRVLAAGGGLAIASGDALVGGIGVSGAPGGEADDACARAGLKAVADALDF